MINYIHPHSGSVQKIWGILLWVGIFFGGMSGNEMYAQALLSVAPVPDSTLYVSDQTGEPTESLAIKVPKHPTNAFSMQMEAVLPDYFRQNPSGYSFLCQKELLIENKLPIGIWIDAERPEYLQRQLGTGLNLRLKLLRF